MEEDTEHKQNFLKVNILDAGYDVDEFVALLHSIKGDQAADVDLWTFDELKNVK
jgi:hypothetical protein